jgi:internalin A
MLLEPTTMSDLARSLIAENKKTHAVTLDLGNCGIVEIPSELSDLVWLESLSLGPEWYQPSGIYWAVNRSYNGGPANACINLDPLSSLVNLTMLNLKGQPINDLRPLAGLSALQILNISDTQVSDLTPLSRLLALQLLYVSDTRVTDLTPLANLLSITKLDISGTQVKNLEPLLRAIQNGISVKRGSGAQIGYGLCVGDCPLAYPPAEIVEQGNIAILNYFDERKRGQTDHLYEAKMLVLGEGGSGKTSLVRRLYLPQLELPKGTDSTRGIDIHKIDFTMRNGRTFRLNVWDFGGQQIYHATHQFFLTHRSLYILLDDTLKDYRSVSDDGFRYWLDMVKIFGGGSPVLIFQNQKGGRSKDIDLSGIRHVYDNVIDRYAGNLEHKDSADMLREAVEYHVTHLKHIGEELPSSWLEIRTEIEFHARTNSYISVNKYFSICAPHLGADETRALLLSRYFHDLGVFLHFQDDHLLKRTVILQNEWATEAVFRILDDEMVKSTLGRFNEEDCVRLWKEGSYKSMHLELLALMQNFELCYQLRDTKTPMWLAPQLLPAQKPDKLSTWTTPRDIVLRYKYVFLPKGLICRLTVRLHRYVRDPEMAWITGVLFEQDVTGVLVEILPSGDEIELRARGPEAIRLLSVVSADLDALNESFKGLHDNVDKRIPCNCKKCLLGLTPEFFAYKDLVRRKEYGKLRIECPRSYDNIDVQFLLDGVDPNHTIRIFIASSSELHDDRDALDLYMRRLNDALRDEGLYLEIIRWEYFLDAMSESRKQDEYNRAVQKCDVFIALFFTKTGKFTEEEFNVAHDQFMTSGKPFIYTYFKCADVNVDTLSWPDFNSLRTFQEKLASLGHYYSRYTNTEDIKLKCREQLPFIRNKLGM